MKINDFILLFFLLLEIIYSGKILAREEILSVVDNDDNQEIYNLVVDVDDQTESLKKLFKDTYYRGNKISRVELFQVDLTTKDGMIVEKRDGYNVLNLKSDNFDNDRGGRIVVNTLYNAITSERRNVDLELAKDSSNKKQTWKLFKGNIAVSKFHVLVNKVIVVGKVGIKTIIME